MSVYILSPRVRSYIFNYMKENHIYFGYVPKSATFYTYIDNYCGEEEEVEKALKDIIENLEKDGVAKCEFTSSFMKSGRAQTLRIPSKYIKKYELYDKNNEVIVNNYNSIYIGKPVGYGI
jgi:hypothetical protein